MRVKAIRGFIWAGRPVDAGDELDVSSREAHLLVVGYNDCVFIGDGPPPPSAMVTHGDPQIFTADPTVESTINPLTLPPAESKRRPRGHK